MVYCRGCGKQIHESAMSCPHCGAQQGLRKLIVRNDADIPDGVKGWSWGAFLLGPIWAVGNKTWIGLLAMAPYVGIVMSIMLGIKGREWAWKNAEWDDLDHFNRVQHKWSTWAVGLVLFTTVVIGSLFAYSKWEEKKSNNEELRQMFFKDAPQQQEQTELVEVPDIVTNCPDEPEKILEAAQLNAHREVVDGPVEEDHSGIGCPYRQSPEAGSKVQAGSTVTYRVWIEGS